MSLFDRWRQKLERLEAAGRYRRLAPPLGIDFTSNDYLGYGARTRGPFANVAEIPNEGQSGMASRLLRGHNELWEAVEQRLANWHGAESALVMNSGYVANEGLLSTAIGPQDWVASDALNHASIIDGLRLMRPERYVYRHNDLDHLETGLRSAAADRGPNRELFIVTESVFSMEGDEAPLRELADLAERYGAHLIVDEAHATGCLGPRGSGLVDHYRLRDRVLASVHTGGKALGVMGAYICGPRLLREVLINRCRHLIFTTALPPIAARCWLQAIDFVTRDDEGRRLLEANTARLRSLLDPGTVSVAGEYYIVPVILGDDTLAVEVAGQLQQHGWDIRAIRPPTVPIGQSRLRISVHADHTIQVIEEVAEAINAIVARHRP